MKKIISTLSILSAASLANAATVNLPFDNTWMQSTAPLADSDGGGTWVTNLTTAPPAASTFTNAVTLGGNSVVNATDEADIGASSLFFSEGIDYVRKTFTLSPFTSVTATSTFSADNGLAVWINGSYIGAETSFAVQNWSAPYSGLDIDAAGNITATNLADDAGSPFTGFVAGQNEIIVAVRNLSPDSGNGAAVFNMQIDTVDAVPDPSSFMLSAVALAGFVLRRRR